MSCWYVGQLEWRLSGWYVDCYSGMLTVRVACVLLVC